MSIDSTLGRRLSMFISMESNITVEMKSSKYKPFICKAKEFVFGEEETRVEFTRLIDTVFPTDTETEKPATYVTMIKDIKKVERIKN